MPKPGRLYIPLDVNFFDEFSHLSASAQRTFLEMLCWSKRVMTDGVLTRAQFERIAGASSATICDELCESQLIVMNGSAILVRSWFDWHEGARAISQRAETKRAAGAVGNHKRWHEDRNRIEPGCPFCDQSAIPSAIAGASDLGIAKVEKSKEEKSKEEDPSPPAPRLLADDLAKANPRVADRNFETDFAELWSVIPKRKTDARGKTLAAYRARRREGSSHADLLAAAKHYADDPERLAKPEFTKGSVVFLAKDGPWENFVHISSCSVSPVRPGGLNYDPDAPSVFDRPVPV